MTEVSEWAEYRIVCVDGRTGRHALQYPTVRGRVLDRLDDWNRLDCGPHTVEQRAVTRIDEPWGQLLATDPQMLARQALEEKVRKIVCPTCKAGVGEPCFNLAVANKTGKTVPTKWPHAERIILEETP